jgi:hypothetical protein
VKSRDSYGRTDDAAVAATAAAEPDDVDGLEQQNPLWFLRDASEKFPHAFTVAVTALLIVAFFAWR